MQPNPYAPSAPAGVTCPWCKHFWPSAPAGADCANCGGALPAPPGPTRGPLPPNAPRRLPEKYVHDLLSGRNVGATFGLFFVAFGVLFGLIGFGLLFALWPLGLGFMAFGGLFGGIGQAIRSGSRKEPRRKIEALTHGVAAEGQILSVSRDHTQTINGGHPTRIEYVFQVNGQPVGGSNTGWDVVNAMRKPGEPLWVVYLPSDPSINSAWPPIA